MPDDNNESKISLAKYRLGQALDCLGSAQREIEAGSYKSAANRSYYCIFHSMRALLAIDGFDSKKHSGIISAFRQCYIKTSVFPAEFSDIIRDAFDARGNSDYEDFFVISKEDVLAQVENAKIFNEAVAVYIEALIFSAMDR